MFSINDVSVTGQVTNLCKKAHTEWKIHRYFSVCQQADYFIESPSFSFADATWSLRIFPNGQRSEGTVGCMSLLVRILELHSQSKSVRLKCTLGIKTYGGGCIFQKDTSLNFNGVWNPPNGFHNFVERNTLYQNRHSVSVGGVMTVFFIANEWESVCDIETQTESVYGIHSLSQDLRSLLNSEQKCDVIVKVKNQKFHTHKLILGARSSVFRAMFEHNMKENSSGEVNIEDCDPEVFQEFLKFIYAGEIEELSSENATQLFTLADKYDLSDLVKMCADFMKSNLDIDIACQVMSIADKHDEKDLRALSKKFIVDNIKLLMLTEQWISFMQENALLANEVLFELIPVRLPLGLGLVTKVTFGDSDDDDEYEKMTFY